MAPDTQQAVRRYIERGLAPIPVPRGSKKPKLEGWENLRITVEEIPDYWTNGQNVGVLCGEPSGWLVDVDLDHHLARKMAGRFLQPTCTSGRQNSPDSHWWYHAEGLQTKTFRDLDQKKKLIEIRSTGTQTLVEPSV